MKNYTKKYTKKQIQEAISYWKKQLKAMNESIDEDSQWTPEEIAFLNKLNQQLPSYYEIKDADKIENVVNMFDDFIGYDKKIADKLEQLDDNDTMLIDHVIFPFDKDLTFNISKMDNFSEWLSYVHRNTSINEKYFGKKCVVHGIDLTLPVILDIRQKKLLNAFLRMIWNKYQGEDGLDGVIKKTYSIDFSVWTKSKLKCEVQAYNENEAKKEFEKQHPEQYDQKDFEIISIMEK